MTYKEHMLLRILIYHTQSFHTSNWIKNQVTTWVVPHSQLRKKPSHKLPECSTFAAEERSKSQTTWMVTYSQMRNDPSHKLAWMVPNQQMGNESDERTCDFHKKYKGRLSHVYNCHSKINTHVLFANNKIAIATIRQNVLALQWNICWWEFVFFKY